MSRSDAVFWKEKDWETFWDLRWSEELKRTGERILRPKVTYASVNLGCPIHHVPTKKTPYIHAWDAAVNDERDRIYVDGRAILDRRKRSKPRPNRLAQLLKRLFR